MTYPGEERGLRRAKVKRREEAVEEMVERLLLGIPFFGYCAWATGNHRRRSNRYPWLCRGLSVLSLLSFGLGAGTVNPCPSYAHKILLN
jgi:hypothetical protein